MQSSALGFLHESAHAFRDLIDPIGLGNDVAIEDPLYGNLEEKRVITQIEKIAAQKLGEPVREYYGEHDVVYVESPTFSIRNGVARDPYFEALEYNSEKDNIWKSREDIDWWRSN